MIVMEQENIVYIVKNLAYVINVRVVAFAINAMVMPNMIALDVKVLKNVRSVAEVDNASIREVMEKSWL